MISDTHNLYRERSITHAPQTGQPIASTELGVILRRYALTAALKLLETRDISDRTSQLFILNELQGVHHGI